LLNFREQYKWLETIPGQNVTTTLLKCYFGVTSPVINTDTFLCA